jgi:hypothetical protein
MVRLISSKTCQSNTDRIKIGTGHSVLSAQLRFQISNELNIERKKFNLKTRLKN